jgi:hypothetical protein
MVTKAASKTTLDPKVFTFDSIMTRIKPPKPETVSVFLAAELAPRIQELERLLDAEDGDDGKPVERGVDDSAPGDELLAEYNELATQWNESEIQFVLRATKRSDRTKARAAMVADGLDLKSEDAEDISTCYVLAEVCENSELTGAQHLEFREQIGEIAWYPLMTALQRANLGSGVSAPFSLRPSRTPDSI